MATGFTRRCQRWQPGLPRAPRRAGARVPTQAAGSRAVPDGFLTAGDPQVNYSLVLLVCLKSHTQTHLVTTEAGAAGFPPEGLQLYKR